MVVAGSITDSAPPQVVILPCYSRIVVNTMLNKPFKLCYIIYLKAQKLLYSLKVLKIGECVACIFLLEVIALSDRTNNVAGYGGFCGTKNVVSYYKLDSLPIANPKYVILYV